MKTKIKTIKEHFNNLGLFLVSGFLGFTGLALLEYEIAKVKQSQFWFLATPAPLTSLTSELMILSSIIILSMLIIIYLKKLDNRSWLWWVLSFEFVLFIITLIVLGTTKFDLIIFG